jgi:hypothetical protein
VSGDDVSREAFDDLEWFGFGKDCRAAVAFFDRAAPIFVIPRKVSLDLVALGFGFLEAQDVWLMFVQKCLDGAFVEDSADTVDVPAI